MMYFCIPGIHMFVRSLAVFLYYFSDICVGISFRYSIYCLNLAFVLQDFNKRNELNETKRAKFQLVC